MIQAPQAQYIPAQYGMPMSYQPQGAPQPVQYQQQNPGYIYNYPTTSSYAQPQQKSQFNGVNIEIINPQGAAPMQPVPFQMPAQFAPIQQLPVYQPTPAVVQAPVVNNIPQPQVVTPQPQVVVPQPQVVTPQPQVVTPQPQVVVPQPQVVVPQPQVVVPQPQIVTPQAEAAAPVIEPQTQANPAISPETFAGKLKSTDLNEQKAAIEAIAENVKGDAKAGPILLDTQIFDALVNIINRDTTQMEGPTPEVIELRNKPREQLTPEQLAKAETATPLENAEINKQYALYTIAFMQERLNNELEKRNNQTLELKDLPCIEDVVTTVKSNPNPRLRHAGISALSYIAKPQYKADLQQIFELAKADEDPAVQAEAEKALTKLNQ